MNPSSWLLWGFVSTLALTTVLSGSQQMRFTRMSLPYMLGTMLTPNRDRANLVGFLVHLVDGWLFSLLYIAAFQAWGRANMLLGAAIGFVHAAVVLTIGMSLLPALHPRMASEQHGPTVVRQLEPPGFLALNYGKRTPWSVLLAHLFYGGVLGSFYQLAL
jgi:hypothetical protein